MLLSYEKNVCLRTPFVLKRLSCLKPTRNFRSRFEGVGESGFDLAIEGMDTLDLFRGVGLLIGLVRKCKHRSLVLRRRFAELR